MKNLKDIIKPFLKYGTSILIAGSSIFYTSCNQNKDYDDKNIIPTEEIIVSSDTLVEHNKINNYMITGKNRKGEKRILLLNEKDLGKYSLEYLNYSIKKDSIVTIVSNNKEDNLNIYRVKDLLSEHPTVFGGYFY